MSYRKFDLIIADVGGTLVKTDEPIMTVVRRVALELGIPEGNPEAVWDVLGTSVKEYIRAYLPEGHKHRTDECHERFWPLFPHTVIDQITPFEGVEQALYDLKQRGIWLAVLSVLKWSAVIEILSQLTFKDWDSVDSSLVYTERSKHSRALGIKYLVKKYAVAPTRTIYIGDTDEDVRQAKKAGVVSAVVKTGGQARKHLDVIQAQRPVFLLDSFRNLCDEL